MRKEKCNRHTPTHPRTRAHTHGGARFSDEMNVILTCSVSELHFNLIISEKAGFAYIWLLNHGIDEFIAVAVIIAV